MINAKQGNFRQLNIIHISDLHFGKNHRFQSEISPRGDRPKDAGIPTLANKLLEDLQCLELDGPTIFCASGDFAEFGTKEEFDDAEKFFADIFEADVTGLDFSPVNTFVAAGNHDVEYDKPDEAKRLSNFVDFYSRLYDQHLRREEHKQTHGVYDLSDSHGVIVVTLNSSRFVQKGEEDSVRGRLGMDQLAEIQAKLTSISHDKLDDCIKVCMVHHHPVLIPQLAEPGRGYDAVAEAGQLLQVLKQFGFHVILHGHKHNPFTFTEDVQSAATTGQELPMFVSCAGSVGSGELPNKISNCYNVMTVKFHTSNCQFRVRCETRELQTHDANGFDVLPANWNWMSKKIFDRFFTPQTLLEDRRSVVERVSFDKVDHKEREELRKSVYAETRGNLPVVTVRPSLWDKQAYEAVCEIVHHVSDGGDLGEYPVEVSWSAGPKFSLREVQYTHESKARVAFQYYGSMLVQAEMTFKDSKKAIAHVYAQIPG